MVNLRQLSETVYRAVDEYEDESLEINEYSESVQLVIDGTTLYFTVDEDKYVVTVDQNKLTFGDEWDLEHYIIDNIEDYYTT